MEDANSATTILLPIIGLSVFSPSEPELGR